MSEPLFKSAHQALTFAFNFSASNYDAPVMNRMAQDPAPAGRGLGGLDGAAQAGMVMSRLNNLKKKHTAVLTARVAPKWFEEVWQDARDKEKVVNNEWKMATSWLIIGVEKYFDIGNIELTESIVLKYVGDKSTDEEIAKRSGVHRNTVQRNRRKVFAKLRKLEAEAWVYIEDELVRAGIVKSTNLSK